MIFSNQPSKNHVRQYFTGYRAILDKLRCEDIEQIIEILLQAREEGRTVFLFGNGGSAALASHFACDLGKGTRREGAGKHFRVISLCDNIPLITAWANDKSYDSIFAEQIANLVAPGDLAVAISGSGNSLNVLRGLEEARKLGATTIGLIGFAGGKMKHLCDHHVIVPSDNMQLIEDLHLSICHALFLGVCQNIQVSGGMAMAAGSLVQSD